MNPLHQDFPFQQVAVDHMVNGITRVWWSLLPGYNAAGTKLAQLQRSPAGMSNSGDWENVGDAVEDVFELHDTAPLKQGMRQRYYYRIKLVHNGFTYLSLGVSTHGMLDKAGLQTARELVRQYEISHRSTNRPGYLLKRRRYGQKDTHGLHPLTGAVIDSRRTESFGTEFERGYYPPVACSCLELDTETIAEDHSEIGGVREAQATGTTTAYPQIDYQDVWVDKRSDKRWSVVQIENIAEVQGVPIILKVTMKRLPESSVIYRIPVDGYSDYGFNRVVKAEVLAAGGSIVNHDHGGADNLAIHDAGKGISGVAIWVQSADLVAEGETSREAAIAATVTTAAGRWSDDFYLLPGAYVLFVQRDNQAEPTEVPFTVPAA